MRKRLLIVNNTIPLNVDFLLPTVVGNESFTATNITTGESPITYTWELFSGATIIDTQTTTDYTYTITEFSNDYTLKLTATDKNTTDSITKPIVMSVDMTMEYQKCDGVWVDSIASYAIFIRNKSFNFRIKTPLNGVTYGYDIVIENNECDSNPVVVKSASNSSWNGSAVSITHPASTPGTNRDVFQTYNITNNQTTDTNTEFEGHREYTEITWADTNPILINGDQYPLSDSSNPHYATGNISFGLENKADSLCWEDVTDNRGSYRFEITGPVNADSGWTNTIPYTHNLPSGSYTYKSTIRSCGGSTKTNSMSFTVD